VILVLEVALGVVLGLVMYHHWQSLVGLVKFCLFVGGLAAFIYLMDQGHPHPMSFMGAVLFVIGFFVLIGVMLFLDIFGAEIWQRYFAGIFSPFVRGVQQLRSWVKANSLHGRIARRIRWTLGLATLGSFLLAVIWSPEHMVATWGFALFLSLTFAISHALTQP
jgi:hypothetical protein